MPCRSGIEVRRIAVDEHHAATRGAPHGSVKKTGGLDAVSGLDPQELRRQCERLRARGERQEGGRGEGDGKKRAKANHGPSTFRFVLGTLLKALSRKARQLRPNLKNWTTADLAACPVSLESGRTSPDPVA